MSSVNRMTMSKNLANFSRPFGGAAAILMSVVGLSQAQSVGAARRDSTVTRQVILLGRTDTISVLAGKIIHERPGGTAWVALTTELDSLLANSIGKTFVMRGGVVAPMAMGLRAARVSKGWLGFYAQGPSLVISDSSGTRYRFFAYQPIISVDPGSPAERAGIEPGDVLVAYNGIDLMNHEFNFSEMLVPKKRVDITVRRDGEIKNYSLMVASPPQDVSRRRIDMDRVPSGAIVVSADGERLGGGGGDRPGLGRPAGAGAGGARMGGQGGFDVTLRTLPAQKLFFLSPNGLFGANLSNMSDELAKVLKRRKGVLVNDVPEDTPAFRSGLRTGDVIITANDDSVTTVGDLRDAVLRHFANHAAELQVVRQQKVKKLTVSWPESP
jgi:S1-C subfamily serine protease